ncbi:MAG: hypothetical protein C0615_06110 [Desulfuromonas sp.]|nr:MAG: hypothetical protein C0615_06110 [Desulfuromonas sp.]
MQQDVIVIGSGLSGLTSALLLARSGRKVLVLEQHARPAPVVNGFSRQGLYFDSGFHYVGGLGKGGAFRPLFRHLGLDRKLELFPFAADRFDQLKIVSTGETYALPVGFAEIRRELGALFPQQREKIDRYIGEIETTWSRFPYLDLNTDIADYAMQTVHGESLKERLGEFAETPELLSLLSMHSLLYGLSPEMAPFTLNAQVAGSYYHSAHGIRGGGRALVAALLELLDEAGVEVRCGAEVTSIDAEAATVSGVTLADGEQLQATEVVATLNPALLPQLLQPGQLRPAYRKRLAGLKQTCSAYIVFARSAQAIESLQKSNLFVQPQPGLLAANPDCPLRERAYYLAAAGQEQNGGHGVIGIIPAHVDEVADWVDAGPQRSPAYRQHKERIGAELLALFADNNPELAGLELLELATPLTLHDYSLAPQGAVYGVGRFLGQYNPHPMTRLRGLFLSGQAIAAPGLLGTVVSSYLTCGSILGHEQLRGEIRTCH